MLLYAYGVELSLHVCVVLFGGIIYTHVICGTILYFLSCHPVHKSPQTAFMQTSKDCSLH